MELPAKWSTGDAPKVCEQCSHVGDEGFSIAIHPDVLAVAFHLCKEIGTEWQMLLSGSVVDKKVYCTGYYIPKQEVSASTVTNLELIDKAFIEENDIVATIHSHALMGVFFSATDDEYTNMSWIKHHIVINNKHEFESKSRYDLPCGGVKFVKSRVETMITTVEEVEGQDKIAKYEYKGNFVGFDTGDGYTPFVNNQRDWNDEYGYWDQGVWKPADKGHEFYSDRYKKVNGVWKDMGLAY